MSLFDHHEFDGHEHVAFGYDSQSGLKAIIALHDTSRGSALGGCRMWPYPDADEALTDVLRLSRGMSYKSALADLPYGGGKSVIIGDPRTMKSDDLFLAMGRFVDTLGGRYVVAEDVGISVADVENMARATRHVAGTRAGGGDPSPATAFGVFTGIRAAIAHKRGQDTLTGLHVAVQGLGNVGYHLCRQLAEAGARLTVSDIHGDAVNRARKEFSANVVEPSKIFDVEADVFAPCALGAILNDETIPRLKAGIIAGSANNQLAEPRHGSDLTQRGILYAPDYVINAGGVIYISHEGPDFDDAKAWAHVARIHDTLGEIFRTSERQKIATSEAADSLARARLNRPSTADSAHAAA